MPSLKGKEYKRFEDIKHIRDDGSECWSARELAPVLDHAKWENFQKTISRAMIALGQTYFQYDLPTPEKSIQQIEKEQMERLQKKAKAGKLMLDE